MKRFLIALLLVAMVVPCAFAEETSKSEIGWDLLDSVTVSGALEHISMNGKFETSAEVKNRMTGFGIGLGAEADLSAIPNFLKSGWYGYFDFGFEFSKKVVIHDVEYTNETVDSILGIKSHLCLLRALDINIPVEVRVGGGLAYSRIGATSDAHLRKNAEAFGLSILGEGILKLGDHFGITLVADLDLSFATKVYSRQKNGSGLVTIMKRSSFGFGLDASVRLGAKYII